MPGGVFDPKLKNIFDQDNLSTKVENAEDLQKLFMDAEKLVVYRYHEPVPDAALADFFHLELPYEDIKKYVVDQGESILSKLSEEERTQVQWEHVGSTSIKGMPGTKQPDALLIIPSFPPSLSVIQAFLDNHYYFGHPSFLDKQDLWFFKNIKEGPLKGSMMTVHVTMMNNASRILLDTRNMCNTEAWAFEDYKNSKIAAAEAKKLHGLQDGQGGW